MVTIKQMISHVTRGQYNKGINNNRSVLWWGGEGNYYGLRLI